MALDGNPPASGSDHVCAIAQISTNNGLEPAPRCWGANASGQLAIGSTSDWGDDVGETIATLPTEPALDGIKVPGAVGRAHTCLGDGGPQTFCFGDNQFGQLGLGHTQNVGDAPGEVAAIGHFSFGQSGVFVSGIGADFTCAWNGSQVYCWGANASGQLGRGDTQNIGDDPGEMLALQNEPVDLGTGLSVASLAVGRAHACARFTNGRMKCWGDNSKGQLGLGDTNNRGDEPGEMGDALPFVPVP